MSETKPEIDFTQIQFPTDRLTIKSLRERFPDVFDVEPPEDRFITLPLRTLPRQSLDTLLTATLDFERILAEDVFRKELRLPKMRLPVLGGRRADLIDSLANSYVSLGVARGKHEARQMLRDVEAQAVAQARQHGGRPR